MEKHKKLFFSSKSQTLIAAIVLLELLSSLHPITFSFAVQNPSEQYFVMLVSSNNQNMTTIPSSTANASSSVSNGNTTNANQPNATLVEFISNIEQIKGHLDQALINKESGNNTLAQAHVLHPIDEVYSNIQVQLANQNRTLNQTLSATLQNLSSTVTNTALPDVKGQIDRINMLLNDSIQTVIPSSDLNNNPILNASVVAQLLNTTGHEYEEAVANGTVKAIVEYQDAQAFIHRAQSIFNSSASRISQNSSSSNMTQEVQEINELFSNLNNAINNKQDPATIEATTINGIIHGLAEITGMYESQLLAGKEEEAGETAGQQDPIAIINHIKSLLNNNLLTAYRSQDYATAESTAIEAYLENYENIETTIAQHDRPLMEQIEIMLREDLRQMIKDRVQVEQIEQQVNMIDANLDRVTDLLQ